MQRRIAPKTENRVLTMARRYSPPRYLKPERLRSQCSIIALVAITHPHTYNSGNASVLGSSAAKKKKGWEWVDSPKPRPPDPQHLFESLNILPAVSRWRRYLQPPCAMSSFYLYGPVTTGDADLRGAKRQGAEVSEAARLVKINGIRSCGSVSFLC
jgi:hypothetical protein